jgi:GNAT superfamily N-acetyltransferase
VPELETLRVTIVAGLRWTRLSPPRGGPQPVVEDVMNNHRLRRAKRADLSRIHAVRHGTAENRLTDRTSATEEEILWYMNEAIFLVSEDDADIQGFACADHQTGYLWALFVIDEAQGRGHGTALMNAVLEQLRQAGHRQAFLNTGKGTFAERYYLAKGWHPTGVNIDGDVVLRLWL